MDQSTADAISVMEKQMAEMNQRVTALERRMNSLIGILAAHFSKESSIIGEVLSTLQKEPK